MLQQLLAHPVLEAPVNAAAARLYELQPDQYALACVRRGGAG